MSGVSLYEGLNMYAVDCEYITTRVRKEMGEDNRDRAHEPAAKRVTCPSCNGDTFAIVPKGTTIVDDDELGDGKVWAICPDCQNWFLVYYQNDT